MESDTNVKPSIIAIQSLILSISLVISGYSIYTLVKVYKRFKTQDISLFLRSLSIVLSSILLIVPLSYNLASTLNPSQRNLYVKIYRATLVMSIAFIAMAIQFDIFKWVFFLVSSRLSKNAIS